jgi:hypothetical protein
MSVNLEWDRPQRIVSPYATLDLNTPLAVGSTGFAWLFQVMIDNYQIVPAKFRPVSDSLSQADGSSIQPPYIDGLVATLEVAYYMLPRGIDSEREPACGDDLRLMDELLMGVLNSLRALPADLTTQQYRWTPTGTGGVERLMNGVMLGSWPAPDFTHGPPEVRVKFELAGPYPYAVDDAPVITSIAAGTSGAVVNGGNSDEMPLIRAYGPTSAFTILQVDTGFEIVYDAGRPGGAAIGGGGDYAEIDCFAGSILLNGNPAADLIAGLDPAHTDLFALLQRSQTIAATGANIDVCHSNAWV